jgi:hypothetical protein
MFAARLAARLVALVVLLSSAAVAVALHYKPHKRST